ncbi:hypothetical protein KJ870_10310 [bacterium]|nr:hypothetical protein [bacterium]MBU1435319.1 hypothetical protein [bacterium]MBU1503517.1 hypothetical protein [bacterium]
MVATKTNGQKVWVTFTLPVAGEVERVSICGEWNSWEDEPMKQKKSGDYYLTKIFKCGDSFEFGYKLNGCEWMTDESCLKVASPYLSENSLLKL